VPPPTKTPNGRQFHFGRFNPEARVEYVSQKEMREVCDFLFTIDRGVDGVDGENPALYAIKQLYDDYVDQRTVTLMAASAIDKDVCEVLDHSSVFSDKLNAKLSSILQSARRIRQKAEEGNRNIATQAGVIDRTRRPRGGD
jgi:hypothetical protein